MSSLITLAMILTPLFIGLFIRLPKTALVWVDKGIGWLVYIILTFIGISLSQVHNIGREVGFIAAAAGLLFVCVIGANVAALMWFDRQHPWGHAAHGNGRKASVSITGSIKQISCVLAGWLLGRWMADIWLPPESANTYILMLLVGLVGVQLGSSGVTLRQIMLNRRGVETSVLITVSALLGGILFSLLMPGVSLSKGLALASGFGWYSLSGIVMTNAYGPVWGGVALANDLAREFFALVFIPLLMRRHPSAAVGVGGATSLDFTLPVIQSAGGLEVVPLAICFGFVINVISPFLMVIFSSAGF